MVGTAECGIDFNKFPTKLDLKQTLHSLIIVTRDVIPIPVKSKTPRSHIWHGLCDTQPNWERPLAYATMTPSCFYRFLYRFLFLFFHQFFFSSTSLR